MLGGRFVDAAATSNQAILVIMIIALPRFDMLAASGLARLPFDSSVCRYMMLGMLRW